MPVILAVPVVAVILKPSKAVGGRCRKDFMTVAVCWVGGVMVEKESNLPIVGRVVAGRASVSSTQWFFPLHACSGIEVVSACWEAYTLVCLPVRASTS